MRTTPTERERLLDQQRMAQAPSEEGALEKRPDLRIQQAHDMVFAKFRELGSARQTLNWLREQQILLPKRRGRRLDSEVVWALPCYGTVLGMLNNPIYAGVRGSEPRRFPWKRSRRKSNIRCASIGTPPSASKMKVY